MARRLRLLAVGVVLAGLGVGCSRCGGPERADVKDPAELAPGNAQLALLIPSALRLGQHAQQLGQLKLVNAVASLAGAGDGQALVDAYKRQLGFDFTKPEGFASVGLDGNGPILSAHSGEGFDLVILTVADADKLDAALTKLAKERLRAPERTERDRVISFSPQNGPPTVAYARKGTYAVLATGPQCTRAVTGALAQTRESSLAANAGYTAFAGANGSRDLVLFAAPESPLRLLGIAGGAHLAAGLEPHKGVITLDAPLSTAQAAGLASLTGSGGSDLVGQLDPDAFIVARTGMDPATLWPIAENLVPTGYRQQLLNAGVRMTEVLGNLKPGAAMSVALVPTPNVARMPSFDPRETNPFDFIDLAALGHVKDPALATHELEQLQKFGDKLGAQVEARPVGKTPAWVFKYPLGEGASIAIDGDRFVVSGGKDRLAPLLARAPAAGYKLPAEVALPFNAAGFAMYLDVSKAVATLRAIPDSAFGLGGFAIRAALNRWLDAIEELKNGLLVADYKASATGGTLHVELTAALP